MFDKTSIGARLGGTRPPSKKIKPEPFRLKVFRWDHLPYGQWSTESGREILFNRHYQPIWERHADGPGRGPVPANRRERVSGIIEEETVFFYNDGTPDKARCALEALKSWGIDLTASPADGKLISHADINKLTARDVEVLKERLWQCEIDALRTELLVAEALPGLPPAHIADRGITTAACDRVELGTSGLALQDPSHGVVQ